MKNRTQELKQYLQPGRHVHLVGIGGVSMRPLGLVLKGMGLLVTGSDMNASVSTDELISRGIQVLAGYTMKEAQVENLVTAKGYKECVAFMGDDGISVVVSTDSGELTEADVAKITDIAVSETGLPVSDVKIMAAN